jgi:5-methylcytosine-specific restriction enzyme A
MSRSVKEWIGASDDTRPPPRVRARVLKRYDEKCYLSGVLITPGTAFEIDHIVALKNGGENRESNLAPVLKAPHKAKTAKDVALKAIAERQYGKHMGIIQPKGEIQSKGFAKAEPQRRASRPIDKLAHLPRNQLFR